MRPSVRPQPFLRHLWTDFVQTWYKGNVLWHTYAHQFISWYDLIWPPGSHFVAIFSWLWSIIPTSLNRFYSNLVQRQCNVAYICLSIYFTIRSNMAARRLFCCDFFMSLKHNANIPDLILFKLGRTIKLLCHTYTCLLILQYPIWPLDSHFVAIFSMSLNYNSNILEPILFTLNTKIKYYAVRVQWSVIYKMLLRSLYFAQTLCKLHQCHSTAT